MKKDQTKVQSWTARTAWIMECDPQIHILQHTRRKGLKVGIIMQTMGAVGILVHAGPNFVLTGKWGVDRECYCGK